MSSRIHELMRAGAVKRFHIVNTTRVQTLAEHQYGVAVLAGEIASRMNLDRKTVALVMAAAIVHDAGEVRTGDIPTPTKRRLRDVIGKPFDDVLDQFDFEIGPTPPHIVMILKCADFLESMVFLEEHQVGRHAATVMAEIQGDADAFFEHCGEIGTIAHQVWADILHATYEI